MPAQIMGKLRKAEVAISKGRSAVQIDRGGREGVRRRGNRDHVKAANPVVLFAVILAAHTRITKERQRAK